jgi:hypothetical protein
MKKHFASISIVALVCMGILSGCVTQNNQNNSTTSDDTEGPTTPNNVRCTTPETDNTPAFSWNASSDTNGVAGYYIKIDSSEDIWVGNIHNWESIEVIADGSHQFYVKAMDTSTNRNKGTYGSCSFIINTTTQEKPPVADAHGPYTWFVNQSIRFDGSKSYDVDGTIVNYTWDLGNGTVLYGKFVTHSYNKAGVYNITLIVTDNDSLTNTNTTRVTIKLYSDNNGTQDNGSGGSTTEQERFLGSWHNAANSNEHWIFYNNWTQKYTILINDNPYDEPFTAELWFDYTMNTSMFCQMPFIDYSGVPSCYGYEFSNNDQVLTLFDNGAAMVVLIKD